MEIEIKKKEHKPLLKRTEVEAQITFHGATPTKKEVIAAVAKASGAKKEMVIVRQVKTVFGNQSAGVTALIYDDRAVLEKFERPSMIKKHTEQLEKKEGEA